MTSTGIVIALLGVAGGVLVWALVERLYRRLYPPRRHAGFDATPDGPLVLLDCEGQCRGSTAHEPDGAGSATCITCGTPRVLAEPEHA